jgi:flavin reductase
VSVAPPSLLVCINRTASIHGPLLERGLFWINVLHQEHQELCSAFSGGLDGEQRFDVGKWEYCKDGLPVLADAQANMLCRVEKECEFATHTIIVGQVLETRFNPPACPLVYLNARFASVAHDAGRENRGS